MTEPSEAQFEQETEGRLGKLFADGRQNLVIGLIQLVFVIAVVGSAIGLSSALKGGDGERAPDRAALRGSAVTSVRVVQPQRIAYAPQVLVNGTVQAAAEVAVSPQVSGEIDLVTAAFRAGAMVEKGDLLFEIDRADYLLAVERAEAEIAAAKSDLALLEAEARLAREEWEQLFPGREISDLAARVPQIDAAKARLGSAQANKRTAELALQRTRVRAPFDARVISSSLDVGQIVAPGQVAGRLVALDSIEIAAPVSQAQLRLLDPVVGRVAMYRQRGSAEAAQMAEVVRVDATLDPRTRLANLYLEPAEVSVLRIGDFVDVALQAEAVSDALVVPATAMVSQDQLWVLQAGKLASRQVSRIGELADGEELIVAGFDFAEGVVALPPIEAEEGQEVTERVSPAVTAAAGGTSDGAQ